jgi:uncharacterized protein YjbI with pentapeptide repeats
MKKILALVALLCSNSIISTGQNKVLNICGNYYNQRIISNSSFKLNSQSQDSIVNFQGRILNLNINSDKDVLITLGKTSTVTAINIDLKKVRSLVIKSYYRYRLNINRRNLNDKVSAHTIQFRNANLQYLSLVNSKIDNVIFYNSDIKYIDFTDAFVRDRFCFHKSSLDSADLKGSLLPMEITMDSLDLNRASKINFKQVLPPKENDGVTTFGRERTLRISNTDLDKLDLPYDRFNFHIHPDQHIRNKIWVYEKLLKHLKEEGLDNNYEYYKSQYGDHIDNFNHRKITNELNIFWWNKGHNKSRTVKISIWVFLLLVVVNLIIFKQLKQVYYPDTFYNYFCLVDKHKKIAMCRGDFSRRDRSMYHFKRLTGVFIYTAFLFWGWRLDIHDLKIKKPAILIYILLQYVLGLLFLAYIINWIVVK